MASNPLSPLVSFGSRSLLDPPKTQEESEEHKRVAQCVEGTADWKRWGPYVSERQWGTCREDYGTNGNSWAYLGFHLAHQVAYRWGEDGIAGFCDVRQNLCLSLGMWNGKDPILKERLFGLGGPQGNHGEDVKDIYYYLDATPTHSYLKMLYKYPQKTFPYDQVRRINASRGPHDQEYELMDTGIFDDDRYFDVFVEYARGDLEDDVLMRVTAVNRGPDEAELHLLPQAFFRNTWSWSESQADKPKMVRSSNGRVDLSHKDLDQMYLFAEDGSQVLLCENETNCAALEGHDAGLAPFDFKGDYEYECSIRKGGRAAGDFRVAPEEAWDRIHCRFKTGKDFKPPKRYFLPGPMYHATGHKTQGPYKDAFHRYVITGDSAASKPATGTKVGFHSKKMVPPGGTTTVKLRLTTRALPEPFAGFDAVFSQRKEEADLFYAILQEDIDDSDRKRVQRQALAGMIWSKQFYYYDMHTFFEGDPGCPKPPVERRAIRNSDWDHMHNSDIISMPDKWEFPWYATWDLAFHCLPLALVDAQFAKGQLMLMTREWYMHPNGQLPAFEWNFSDVNPPVHAWAVWRVYQMDRKQRGDMGDLQFLEEVFHKLMINFTWWVNRKDAEGNNIFQGGFLGLDNIGVFDRGGELPTGGKINQSDGTSWMAFYSLNMMRIALELALHNSVYEGIAAKFFEHFLHIARAMTRLNDGAGLWDQEDEFYYDVLTLPDGERVPLKVRSMVGLIPLFAVEVLEPTILERLPRFNDRANWLMENRKDLAELVSRFKAPGVGERRLLSLLRGHRMKCMFKRMLDPTEFLSDFGVRALSRYHLDNPYVLNHNGRRFKLGYEPAEASVKIMGGNSNWRGPIWFPMNYLIIESLQKFHQYYGADYLVECPAGSGEKMSCLGVADFLTERLIKLFEPQGDEGRPSLTGVHRKLGTDPHFKDYCLFYEHFHGDNGRGVGAAHQTGWTGLIAKLIQAAGVAAQADQCNGFRRQTSGP